MIRLIGIAVIWTCVPTAAIVLGRLAGWGSAGGWLGFVAETGLGAVLFAWRWRRGAWREAYRRPDSFSSSGPLLVSISS